LNTENQSKRKDLENSLELFEDEKTLDDLEKDITYSVKIPKDATNNILKISRMIKIAVLTLSGYEEQPKGNGEQVTYKLTKQPLASSEVIKGFQGILEPYADESNMVTKKNWDSFVIQARADWGAFYKLCLREKASPEEKERTVYRIFQGCLINIGEITCDNPGNMNTLFGNINREVEEENLRKVY
jgi:hypothetical protein